MNTELLTEFQLQAGGSHYPEINPKLQEAFARMIVDECVKICLESSHRNDDMGAIIANNIKRHFGME